MDTIKDRIIAARKEKKGEKLSASKWEPKEGVPLMGEYIHREVIKAKNSDRTFEIVTLRNEEGLWNTLIQSGTFQLGSKPPIRGDLLEINFHSEPNPTDGKEPFMRAEVTVYHVGTGEQIPF